MENMNDWLVVMLISIRDMASDGGHKFTAERLDEAILTATNEIECKNRHCLRGVDIALGQDGARARLSAQTESVRRYH